MKNIIYIEKEIINHKKTQEILSKFKDFSVIEIDRYSEIFNRKNQDFKAQKNFGRSFILAHKKEVFVHKNPEYCVSSLKRNYYFSTTLNCPFDCEYCFLQGMYRSAYPLIFINTDDFKKEIGEIIQKYPKEKIMFFSGYDNDSLALDVITNFSEDFIPWFEKFPNAILEMRTKSANIQNIKKLKPTENTLLTWTLSPKEIQETYERKTASLIDRIKALKEMQKKGWKVGIRIEPIIYSKEWKVIYKSFFEELKKEIDFTKIENIYFGLFKIPKDFFKKMKTIHPNSKLFHRYFEGGDDGQLTYEKEKEEEIKTFMKEECSKLIVEDKVFYVY